MFQHLRLCDVGKQTFHLYFFMFYIFISAMVVFFCLQGRILIRLNQILLALLVGHSTVCPCFRRVTSAAAVAILFATKRSLGAFRFFCVT